MKVSELRALIGKRVSWRYAIDPYRGTYRVGSGILQDFRGKNVLIDDDWLWLPNLKSFGEDGAEKEGNSS
ncbi:hypothetical protein [Thioalkalivibrio sp. ALE16]|uniref:hypothetical protein n=1 Tax=Thioalkalivibrio sp. ALE16 TaxID=1158172 RepID=UPI0003686B41|nr:hypothetical protein [Thioalkalivibrio sp. ALE16]